MKLNIFPKALFRIPQFPLNTTLAEAWPELKRAIQDASSYFYNIIKDLEHENIPEQPQHVQWTIDKYFNRARFRATPYGTFASIGICNLSSDQLSLITVDSQKKEHRFIDWKETLQVQQLWKEIPKEKLLLQTNDSYYRYSNKFRYLYKGEERFELSEMPFYQEIDNILQCCRQTTPLLSLLQQAQSFGLDKEELSEIVTELIESQLLFTNYHPNIIGEDYFKKIGLEKPVSEHGQYTICSQDTLSGTLNRKEFEPILEAIRFFHAHSSNKDTNSDLTAFKTQFRGKYDMEAVPIMQALDPVLGIGYGNMESETGISEIVSKITALKRDVESSGQNMDLKQYLLKELASAKKSIINLSDFASGSEKNNLPLPNAISALVNKVGQHLMVEQLGGATATSLLGRFSLTGGEVHQLCADIANLESNANPDVIFFDIAYMGEPSVDNVNRRLHIYDHDISICCWNEQESKIGLDDIYVLLRGNDLILHSKSRNKRIIPRLSTAYNFTRSDLSLFRLLCDIQNQGIVTNLIPDLKSIIPNADHYPRLAFKNLILAGEAWRVHYKPEFEQQHTFKSYLKTTGLSRYIKAGFADQTLRLDMEKQKDINLLCAILKARKELLLSEVLPEENAIVQDSTGNPYTSEFILSFFHQEEIYRNIPVNYEVANEKRNFPPGSEWIYFNLFCNTSIANEILTGHIQPLLHTLRTELTCWFFIRYNEGGDHIRLRLKPKDQQGYQKVFQVIGTASMQLMELGLLKDIQLATYKRELERYNQVGIGKVESHFSVDSRYALWLLDKDYSDEQLYRLIAHSMLKVGTEIFGRQVLSAVIKTSLLAFQKEHSTDSSIYKEVNQVYRKSRDLATFLDLSLTHSFISLIHKAEGETRVTLFTDLFHMHINRIFPQDQRVHEYIVYEYLNLGLKQRINFPILTS